MMRHYSHSFMRLLYGPILGLSVCLSGGVFAAAAEPAASELSPFYAMDTCVREWADRTPEQVARLLKELGYDGYGHGGTNEIPEYLAALQRHGLRLFNTYVSLDLDADAYDPALEEVARQLQNTGAMLWVPVAGKKFDRATQTGDERAVERLRRLAEAVGSLGVKIAIYPDSGRYIENIDEAVRIARKVNRPNLGVSFNLCHHLRRVGGKDIEVALAQALPYLFQVSINGADDGDTMKMGWDRLIRPLDQGTYDVARLMRTLHTLGYRGPVGLQGYGIKGEPRLHLQRSIEAWNEMKKADAGR